jgi:hypothetical protein
VVTQKTIGFDYVNVMNLGRLQNLARAFRASDIGARPHFAPTPERVTYANLRPNAYDQRHADVE